MENEYFEFLEQKIGRLNSNISDLYLLLKLMKTSDEIPHPDKKFFESLYNDCTTHFDKWTEHFENVQELKEKSLNEREKWYE